jgi:hypothetical protein
MPERGRLRRRLSLVLGENIMKNPQKKITFIQYTFSIIPCLINGGSRPLLVDRDDLEGTRNGFWTGEGENSSDQPLKSRGETRASSGGSIIMYACRCDHALVSFSANEMKTAHFGTYL